MFILSLHILSTCRTRDSHIEGTGASACLLCCSHRGCQLHVSPAGDQLICTETQLAARLAPNTTDWQTHTGPARYAVHRMG
jgi:hypothetical protein